MEPEQPSCQAAQETPLVQAVFTMHHLMMRIGDRLTQPLGLSASRWMLLCTLNRAAGPVTVSDLAGEHVMSVQAISRMLTVMEAEGLIEKTTRPGHGRAVDVALTPAGCEAIAALERLGAAFSERFLDGFASEDLHRLEDDFSRLIENLCRYEEQLVPGRHGSSRAAEESP